jgi:hypothetical protein
MSRRKLQTALLVILATALVLSSAIAALLVYSDRDRFVAACLLVRNPQTSNQTGPQSISDAAIATQSSLCLKDIAAAVANTVGTAFGPLFVIMLSVIFMQKPLSDDLLDRSQSIIALAFFALIQVLAVLILTWSVALTPNLLDLRPDALQNAIFTAVQGIIVAFVFPRGDDKSAGRQT